MKINTRRVTILLILVVLLLISLYFIVRYTAIVQNRNTVAALDTIIVKQEKLVISLTDTARLGGADSVTERLILDCSATDRQRFDTLLDLLSGTITKPELTELNTLFYRCGNFYAARKSALATKLKREVDIFAQYYDLRLILSNTNQSQVAKLDAWQKLAEAELKTAEYFNKLVVLQGTIISELTAGKSATAPTIVATLSEVSSVRGQMVILSKQIEVYKTEALAL